MSSLPEEANKLAELFQQNDARGEALARRLTELADLLEIEAPAGIFMGDMWTPERVKALSQFVQLAGEVLQRAPNDEAQVALAAMDSLVQEQKKQLGMPDEASTDPNPLQGKIKEPTG